MKRLDSCFRRNDGCVVYGAIALTTLTVLAGQPYNPFRPAHRGMSADSCFPFNQSAGVGGLDGSF